MNAPRFSPEEPTGSEAASLPPAYFEAMYAENPDPWDFETSAYEAAKYAATLEALPRPTYANAFEIGCSIGVLTKWLAARCERLLSVDVSEHALARAKARCHDLSHVRFEQRRIPADFPDETFDLILVSEVGYYWSLPDLEKARAGFEESLTQGGHLLLVHWTPFVDDYPLTGDAVHEAFLNASRRRGAPLRPLYARREDRYRLDLFERR
ncbi:MAG: SAM-dependent methyltransferase [Rhodothermales bacterium]